MICKTLNTKNSVKDYMLNATNNTNTYSSKTPFVHTFIQKLSFFLLLITTLTTLSHAKSALAKEAGMSDKEMQRIINKVIKIETTSGSYTAHNKKSGAYGRYQIMPRTARAYAKKLHIPYSQWKLPKNQDRIFHAILKDNIRSLKRNGIKVSAFSIYGTHQQGAGGFHAIMKKKHLSKKLERNLRRNLPKALSTIPKSRLKHTWIRYWKKKFS